MARRPQQLLFPLSPVGDRCASPGLCYLLAPISLPLPPKQETLPGRFVQVCLVSSQNHDSRSDDE